MQESLLNTSAPEWESMRWALEDVPAARFVQVEHPVDVIKHVLPVDVALFGWWGRPTEHRRRTCPTDWTPHLVWRSERGWFALQPGARPRWPWTGCGQRKELLWHSLVIGPKSTLAELALYAVEAPEWLADEPVWRRVGAEWEQHVGPLLWGLLQVMPDTDVAGVQTLIGLAQPALVPHIAGCEQRGVRRVTDGGGDPAGGLRFAFGEVRRARP